MCCKTVVEQENQFAEEKLALQRWFYILVGILTMIPIILLSLRQILNMTQDNEEFPICLLLIVHSGSFYIR